MGHNEDALSETLNYWYLVDAHVVEPGFRDEKFTSLSYAGFLPGYTMGYNCHGLVYSVNTLSAKTLSSGKTRKLILMLQIKLVKCTHFPFERGEHVLIIYFTYCGFSSKNVQI